MSEINQFALYSQCSGVSYSEDEVSLLINKLNSLDGINEVTSYLKNKFGEFEEEKTVDYPKLNKKIEISNDDLGLAVSALENDVVVWCMIKLK